MLRKKHLKFLIPALLVLVWLITGPAPVPEILPFYDAETAYRRANRERLAQIRPAVGQGEIFIGTARRDISCAPGQPLMGFTNRSPLASTGNYGRCYATALTVNCGSVRATIVALDLFILLPELTDAIIAESGIPAEELYFTATHTHSGPGGWLGNGIFPLIYGPAEKRYRRQIVTAVADAIRESRIPRRRTEIFLRRAETPAMLENRIFPKIRPAREIIDAVVFRDFTTRKILAAFMTYSAHATLVRPAEHRCSPDYPGFFRDAWEKSHGGVALFAAGCIGDGRGYGEKSHGADAAEKYGSALAEILSRAPERKTAARTLARLRLPLTTPITRIPCGKNWRWLPLIAPRLLSQQTFIAGLRIGEVVLLGFPGDIAGELAPAVEDFSARRNITPIITSFNGDWRGYFTTRETYLSRKAYEVRMGFLGRDSGWDFQETGREIIKKLTE